MEELARHLTGWRAQVRQAVDFQFPHAQQRRPQVLGDALSEVVFVAQGVGRRNPTNDKRAAVANGRGAGIAARPCRSTWKRPSNHVR